MDFSTAKILSWTFPNCKIQGHFQDVWAHAHTHILPRKQWWFNKKATLKPYHRGYNIVKKHYHTCMVSCSQNSCCAREHCNLASNNLRSFVNGSAISICCTITFWYCNKSSIFSVCKKNTLIWVMAIITSMYHSIKNISSYQLKSVTNKTLYNSILHNKLISTEHIVTVGNKSHVI